MPFLAAAVGRNVAPATAEVRDGDTVRVTVEVPAADWGKVRAGTAVVKARVLASSKVRATDEARSSGEVKVRARPMGEAKARAADEVKAAEAVDAAKRSCDAYPLSHVVVEFEYSTWEASLIHRKGGFRAP